ncbi:MAG: hypothetical protein H6707_18365 [Deltaproteobacteria bacterium]|nr:hypothetical protein [Deltaproteobacteria bacterium]
MVFRARLLVLVCLALVACGSDRQAINDDGGALDAASQSDAALVTTDGALPVDVPLSSDGQSVDASQANNQRCSTPQKVAIVGGKASIADSTAQLTNEFGNQIFCGFTRQAFAGPQRYYLFDLSAASVYTLKLTTQGFDGALYAFPATVGCAPAAIENFCADHVADEKDATVAETLTLTVAQDGPWVVVVDAPSAGEQGAFTLELTTMPAPKNLTCQNAQAVTLSAGSASLQSTTALSNNEFADKIDCGGSFAFEAPQLYYSVALKKGQSYRVMAKPEASFDLALYAFLANTPCDVSAINGGCSAYLADDQPADIAETLLIEPSADQTWKIVVDGARASAQGAFALSIDQLTKPNNTSCSAPQTLTLSAGKVTVKGDTFLSTNEFGNQIDCGTRWDYDAKQLYYKVALKAGSHYRVAVDSSTFDPGVYAFPANTPCDAAAINKACAGYFSDVDEGKTDSFIISPAVDQEWIIVVDSDWEKRAGAFELSVEQVALPTNAACSKPQSLALSSGKLSHSGDSTLAQDEFGGAIDCGGSASYDGPQLYYKAALKGGKTYRVTLTPTAHDAALYAFAASTTCDAAAINAACGAYRSDSGGGGDPETITISPIVDADWVFVADGSSAADVGSFKLDFAEIVVPKNASCKTPQALTLVNGKATVTDDSTAALNEFGTDVSCGAFRDFDGAQLYYKVALTGGQKYTVKLTPNGFDGALYAFVASVSCSGSAIEAACKGNVSEQGGKSSPETLTLAPIVDANWIIVVDSWISDQGGPFSLTVERQP